MLYALGDNQPVLSERHFIAPDAVVIGNVTIGEDVSIWFNAVIRGDNAAIEIGEGSNIQECSVLHVDEGVPLSIGKNVTVGHKVMLHGCTIGDGSLIGMNAVVLNNAVIGKNCLIGANALVTEGTIVPDGSMVLGSPAKIIKPLSEAALVDLSKAAQNYKDKIDLYNNELSVVRC
ncbi:gamma carbonic anhydrase family protein [Granulosicoccus antarcticus]|uniref:Carnitine operon protein CaiE n=1 Tax=Granulosicoccus antarcticus IMCC3135 TaxID=1192854 RepID=A0A2Z2NVY9_9GAMM|nr:gamma carbonic anhydrase family protein [Granulosicoccus antarcticus]ASJ75403.1 Carnitine operon protein CaiE [Granulosicoccus antarcticus IMCC3135]